MAKNRISEKKLFMMVSVELFAMTSLILPAILTRVAGKNGLPVLLMASGLLFLLAGFYLWCVFGADGAGKRKKSGSGKKVTNSYVQDVGRSPDQMLEGTSALARGVYGSIYTIRYFIHGLFLMILFVNLIGEVLLPDWNLFWILLPVLLLVYMTAGKQLRVRGRILEVLFPYIFLPLLIVLVLALFQLDYSSLPDQLWGGSKSILDMLRTESGRLTRSGGVTEHGNLIEGVGVTEAMGGLSSFFRSTYIILMFYQPLEFLLFLLPALCNKTNQKKRVYTVGLACLFVILINVLVFVTAIGMFGTVRTSEKLWSSLYIMQSVRLPGKFVERLDILFLVFWIFSVFALFSAYLYYGSRFFTAEENNRTGINNRTTQKNDESNQYKISDEKGWLSRINKSKAYAIAWLVGILVCTMWIQEPEQILEFFLRYKMWVDFPLSILLPLVIYRKKWWKIGKSGVKVAVIGVMCTFMLTGCQNHVDIEEKNYVMSMGVEQGETKKFKFIYEIAELSQSEEKGSDHKSQLLVYEADSFEEANEMDRKRDDKKLDFGHLKALVLSRQMMENGALRQNLIAQFEQDTSVAGTTLLFFTDESVETLIETGGQQDTSFGEYMEKMVTNQKSRIGEEDSLSRFLRDEAEEKQVRNIFLLGLEGDKLVLSEDVLPNVEGDKDTIDWIEETVYSQSETECDSENEVMKNAEKKSIEELVLRFHVRANSDSVEDQNLKVAVKNRILPKLQTLLESCDSKDSSMQLIAQSLSLINQWVQEACEAEQYDCETNAYLCRETFPEKQYGDMTLPAGEYDALRIDLGEANGGNWWCMMYPSLCLVDGVVEAVPEESKEVLEQEMEKEEYEALFLAEDEETMLTHLEDRKEDEVLSQGTNEKTEVKFHVKWKLVEVIQNMLQ